MKIGIFDSGLGGLVIARSIFKKLPKYNYIYLGDTKNVPYGDKSQEEIFKLTGSAIDFLFKQGCGLVILACNTASAVALRRIQQEYLPKSYPNRRVLGVIVPTLEEIGKEAKKIGVLATASTVKSHVYKKELKKINPNSKIIEQSVPVLVPLIENNDLGNIDEVLSRYINPLKKQGVDDILLGCTHFPILKKEVKKLAGNKIKIISQEDIIPKKLADYLKRHPEISNLLTKKFKRSFYITQKTPHFAEVAKNLFGKPLNLELAKY